jgi:3-hydroxyisobutyrate dehydrogenase-like beta-hydroxyacid dehydrogenase
MFRMSFVGTRLVSHRAAENILEMGGHSVTVFGHRNRKLVVDLVRLGVSGGAAAAALTAACDVLILCQPSPVQVKNSVRGERLSLTGTRGALTSAGSTIANPLSTRCVALPARLQWHHVRTDRRANPNPLRRS